MKKFFALVLSALLLSSCGGGETASSSSIPSGSKESSVETSIDSTPITSPSVSESGETSIDSTPITSPSVSESEETSVDSTPITSPSVSESEETSVHTHTFDMENWSYDETHHWHDSTCGHDVVADYAVHDFQDETIAPTFEKGGYTLHTCKVCGYSYQDNETDPKEHVYSDSWSYNEEGHYHACLDQGYENLYVDFTRHSFDAAVTPATIDAGGFTTYTCSVCGYSYQGDFTEPLTEAEFYMEFALNPGDDSYALVAVKNSPEVLHIPALYEGLPVTRIGAYAFANSRNTLKEVYLGENIDTLDDGAFSSCLLLEHVEISPNLSIVHEGVFDGCPSLRYNELDGSSYLGNEDNPYYILLAVSEEAPKDELILPEETKIIATYDLKAAKIEHVVFPDGLIDIPVGESFIYFTSPLEPNYLIEGKLHYMGSKNNPHLLCVGSEGGSTNESSRNYVFHEDTRFITCGAFYWASGVGGIVASATFAGDNMLEIGSRAFMNNQGLRDFVYPSTIKKLGSSVLSGCTNNHTALPDGIGIVPGFSVDKATEGFAFPSKAYGVRAYAFSGAYDLEDVDLSQIEWADQGAFDSCSAKSWVLTSRTRRFEGAFSGYYTRMNTLYFRGDIMDYFSLPLGSNPYLYKNTHLYLEDEAGGVVHNGVTYTLLENVVLPDGLKEIPDCAFYGKIDLKTISIPDSVVSIGRDAFTGCSSLAFSCVDGLKYLGNEDALNLHCFGLDGTSSSSEVVIVDGCRTIASEAFGSNKTITSVALPDSLVYIGDYAFNYCSKLTTVIGGSGLTALGEGAFCRCGITSIDISNLVDINNFVFVYCRSLQTIALSDRLEKIGDSAFSGCSSLVMTLALPETLTSIGSDAFSGCSQVTGDVVIPDSVDTLGRYAFDSSGITSLHLGANVPADVIFGRIPSLTGYTVSEDNAFYQAVDGVLYDADMISLISYPAARGAEEYTLPETVTRLETYCFANVNIPNFIAHENITYFGSYAFSDSGLVRSINGANYLGVGENQYYYLLEVTKNFTKNDTFYDVPEGVVFMASEAIRYEYYLKYIYLSSTIQSIGYHAIYSLTQFVSLSYAGTKEQWGEVELADKWFEDCNGVSVVKCTDGTVAIA